MGRLYWDKTAGILRYHGRTGSCIKARKADGIALAMVWCDYDTRARAVQLAIAAQLTGWPTPMANQKHDT